jgi:uncharacterized protein
VDCETVGAVVIAMAPCHPNGDQIMANPFVHVELMSTDIGKSKAFYGKLFDWTLEDVPLGDSTYTMIKVGEGTGGGLMKNPMPNASSSWLAYVQVDELKKAVEKAKSPLRDVIAVTVELTVPGTSRRRTEPRVRCSALADVSAEYRLDVDDRRPIQHFEIAHPHASTRRPLRAGARR